MQYFQLVIYNVHFNIKKEKVISTERESKNTIIYLHIIYLNRFIWIQLFRLLAQNCF